MAFVEMDAARLILHTSYGEKDAAKLIPGVAWSGKEKIWTLPKSWGSLVALRGVFGDRLSVSDELRDWSWKYFSHRVKPALELRDQIDTDIDMPDVDSRLRGYQRAGVAFIDAAHDVLLADEMGTGKTVVTLQALRRTQNLPALIIALNSVKGHWESEIHTWYPTATPYIVRGNAKQRKELIDTARQDPNAIVVVNFEAVRLFSRLAPYGSIKLSRCGDCDPKHGDYDLAPSRCDVHPKLLNGFGFKSVVIDEAHKIKDPKSKVTRAVWALCHEPSVQQRIGTTGTPIEQQMGDLWSPMHAIAPYDFPVRSKFVDRYALYTWNAYGGLDYAGINPQRSDEFFKIFYPHFRRMLKARVLPELPPKVRIKRYVDMSQQQSRMYNEFARSLATRNEDGELMVSKGNLPNQTRLLQLASSSMSVSKPDPTDLNSWEYEPREPSSKLDELMAVVEELGETQFVVAAEHAKLIRLASARFDKAKIRHTMIIGDIAEYDRHKALAALRNREVRALLFTVSAGGTGLDMSCVDTMIYLQRPWSMIKNKQTEDRVHRFGSVVHQVVRIIDIITRGTVEEKQIERIHAKFARLDEITQDTASLLANGIDPSSLEREVLDILDSDVFGSVMG